MPHLGGWLWALIDVALVTVLALAIVFGVTQWRRWPRNDATEQARDDATRRGYDSR